MNTNITYSELKNKICYLLQQHCDSEDIDAIKSKYSSYMSDIGMDNSSVQTYRNLIAYLNNVINFTSRSFSFNVSASVKRSDKGKYSINTTCNLRDNSVNLNKNKHVDNYDLINANDVEKLLNVLDNCPSSINRIQTSFTYETWCSSCSSSSSSSSSSCSSSSSSSSAFIVYMNIF